MIFGGKMGKYFNSYIENPLKTWIKAKKYFKRPKISFRIFRVKKYSGYPYVSYLRLGKILDIYIHDVWYKDKYNSPRHERNPLIYICLFRLIAISINFNIYYNDEFGEKQNGDMEYWEYILNWIYYKDKKTLKCYSNWIGLSKLYKERIYGNAEDDSEDTFTPMHYVIPVVAMSLNKKGIEKLKEELKNNKE